MMSRKLTVDEVMEEQGTLAETEGHSGAIPGDPIEGGSPRGASSPAVDSRSRRDQSEIDAEMRAREAALEPREIGQAGKGVEIGTPAGGSSHMEDLSGTDRDADRRHAGAGKHDPDLRRPKG
jgi:hypothetical protein